MSPNSDQALTQTRKGAVYLKLQSVDDPLDTLEIEKDDTDADNPLTRLTINLGVLNYASLELSKENALYLSGFIRGLYDC